MESESVEICPTEDETPRDLVRVLVVITVFGVDDVEYIPHLKLVVEPGTSICTKPRVHLL